jgi:hypothetical protein
MAPLPSHESSGDLRTSALLLNHLHFSPFPDFQSLKAFPKNCWKRNRITILLGITELSHSDLAKAINRTLALASRRIFFSIVAVTLGGGLEDIPVQGNRDPLRPKALRETAGFHRSAEFRHQLQTRRGDRGYRMLCNASHQIARLSAYRRWLSCTAA